MRRLLVTGLVLAGACGDNLELPPDAADALCAPTPPALSTMGAFADPLTLPLPATCVVGGLADLPGRWFVVDPTARFTFEYPKFDGTCTTGFRRANWQDDDHDLSDGSIHESWSDGTRVYYRDYYRFEFSGDVFEYAIAFAACLLPDGSMAAVEASFDTDRGERFAAMTGKRFGARDAGAAGLSRLGELGLGKGGTPIIGYNLAIDGVHAYVAGPLGLDVIDVTNPAAPVAVGHLDGSFNDVKLARGNGKLIAYAAPLNDDPTAIIDVTVPATPTAIGQIGRYSHSLFMTPQTTPPKMYFGDYTSTVPVYDITDPAVPVFLGAAPVPATEDGIHDIHVDGSRIYVNKTTEGFVAIDTATGLTTPTRLGGIPTSYSHASWSGTAGGRKIVLHGDEGMTPDGGALLRIVDADETSATFMTEIARFQSRPEVGIHNIVLVGDKAYIAYYHDGIRVVDLATPTQPREAGRFNTWDEDAAPGAAFEGALGLVVAGDRIYVADSLRGLIILRID